MPKYINADRLKVEETAAFENVQPKLPKVDKDINEIVHIKLHKLLDDAPAENVRPVAAREQTGFPEKVENPCDVAIYDLITVIRAHENEIKVERFVSEWSTLADIKTNKGDSITVIAESGLNGGVYRYGSHGEYWEQIGEVCGYA